MRRDELKGLHYITAIENVPSILRLGILSNRQSRRLRPKSIAKREVQNLRAKVRIPGGLALHDYANLYFNARNPMMFLRQRRHAELCVIRISPDVLDIDGVVISDRNAASDYVRFEPSPHGLRMIGQDVFAEDWRHPDKIEYWRRKSRVCAEVLVPDRVPPELIFGAYVSGEAGSRKLVALNVLWHIGIDPWMFFRGSRRREGSSEL